MNQSTSESWISVCGEAAPLLAADTHARIQDRLAKRQFRQDEIDYVKSASCAPIQGELRVSESELNILRRLCQAWDIELRPAKITSHRPLIGPVIVGVKRLLFPLVQVFLKDLVRQQRDFNSSAIALMGTLLSERDKPKK